MFTIEHLGKHKNILTANFGNGTITFHKARNENDAHSSMLLFQDSEKVEIGHISTEDAGKTTDEIERPALIMRFSNPESITALVHSLLEIQKELFTVK